MASTTKTLTCANCCVLLVHTRSKKYYACPRCGYCDACAECPCLCPTDDTFEIAEVGASFDLAFHAVSTLNEKLWMQEDNQKDVALSGDGGMIRAHSFVLSAASEAFAGILKHRTENHDFPGVNVVTLKVFLRLLYTGCVSKDDWEDRSDGEGDGRSSPSKSRTDRLPLNILLDVAGFAKKYMATTVLPLLLQVLQVRLDNSFMNHNVQVFVTIFSGAITHDLRPLLMAGLDRAKRFEELKVQYDSQCLPSEVAYELLAIWPLHNPEHKRRRLF